MNARMVKDAALATRGAKTTEEPETELSATAGVQPLRSYGMKRMFLLEQKFTKFNEPLPK
jgi:hypothetical protein